MADISFPSNEKEQFKFLQSIFTQKIPTLAPLLPAFLSLNGKPYTLRNHYMMAPLFDTCMPWKILFKCGRQISKSTSLSAQGIMQTSAIPFFNTLFVLPLFESTRRLSTNYVRAMIEQSPIKEIMVDKSCNLSVLQKTFRNNSKMIFSYAFLNCDRVRGISADKLIIDEIQDMDWEFLPVIQEVLSASQNWGLQQYSGTPKTFDNTIQALWEDTTQSEWVIKCQHCNHYNIPSVAYDVMGMIGPTENIDKHGTALICAKCCKWIDSRSGRWVAARPDKRTIFSGYHVPQIILPMHFSSEKKWTELLIKRDKGVSPAAFLNECLGESCDLGTKLVTYEELRKAASLHQNTFDVARKQPFTKEYIQRVIGIDWGGGGLKEVSYTAIAVVGLRPDYRLELIYAERLHTATSDTEEVKRIIDLFTLFQCAWLAHDFGGSGSVHETLLIQAGFPYDRIIPFNYVRAAAANMISHHPPTANTSRHFWSLDKARSLILLCTLLKTLHLQLTEWESSKNLLEDFLNLIEDKVATKHAGDIFTVTKSPNKTDDIVHAINFACCAHFHTTQQYPNVAQTFELNLTDKQMRAIALPANHTKPNFSIKM